MVYIQQGNQNVYQFAVVTYRLFHLLPLLFLSAFVCGGDEEIALSPSIFPNLLWGTATAAHQVEGFNMQNDWYLWEMMPGKIRNGDVSGIADDHYHRFDADPNGEHNEMGWEIRVEVVSSCTSQGM